MSPPVTAIIIGAGNRGQNYASYAKYYPEKFKVVAICDVKEATRNKMQSIYNISDDMMFSDWKSAADMDKFADCVVIATPDACHKQPAVAFASKRYHILLEKPMATTEEDCVEIYHACQQNDVMLLICHVLRYTPEVMKIRDLIDSGKIGEVVNVRIMEPIGFWHFAHSFVRGNWRNEAESTFSLLAKSCHDIDLIQYFMAGERCINVSSFGHLTHFTPENKPDGAASRCLDCPDQIETRCPYSAKRLYLDEVKSLNKGWPLTHLTATPDIESITEALRSGPYGRCVYESDNDVVSHQVVNLQYSKGQTASFTMMAFSEKLGQREIQIFGTRGQITYNMDGCVRIYDFVEQCGRNISDFHKKEAPSDLKGHGSADFETIESFVEAVRLSDRSLIRTGPEESLMSHRLVFAAEKARSENRVITINPDGSF